ncbi:MAG TPA: hypothetical protein ENJ10_07640 [Caldithrix abyssi]|uniref:Uncharacterized protein n=1 Tax=Caldithrix abyssi TaxID=187145 RepID=A0A7V1PV37_CALAY|nr:hypothetical protein [Caldithrix abyssi]
MKQILFFATIVLLTAQSCDAPRLNPLDPDAQNYQLQSELLQLRRLSNPTLPVSSVTVIAPELGLSGVSDANGEILFSHGKVDYYQVQTLSDLYFKAAATVRGGGFNDPLLLNAKPVVHTQNLHSIYNNTNKSTEYLARLEVSDDDGPTDIRRVELSILENSYRDTLQVLDGMSGIFLTNKNIINIDADITAGTLPEMHFVFSVFNQNGDSLQTIPVTITRVIEQELFFTEPAPQSNLSGTITFKWNNVNLDFSHTFELEIFSIIDNSFRLIKSYTALPAGTNSKTISESAVLDLLSAVNNFARVSIVDNSGNICYSVPLFFTYGP